MTEGATRVRGRAVQAAVRHQLRTVDDIEFCTVKMLAARHAVITLNLRDGALESEVRAAVERRLGIPFWIDLGMADADYTIRIDER